MTDDTPAPKAGVTTAIEHKDLKELMATEFAGLRDYVDGRIAIIESRLDGMDKAAVVLHETVTRTPTEIQLAIGHLKELTEEKFVSVSDNFMQRDKALDAALAAQKETAGKSEGTTQKLLDAQAANLSDLKTRVDRIEAAKQGGADSTVAAQTIAAVQAQLDQSRRSQTLMLAAMVVTVLVAVVGFALQAGAS
jgi:hypothetical protein